tara:strand:+ start:8662 stop:9705 length:1044 start_codon:yes stop_codon:yes gene_type:complete
MKKPYYESVLSENTVIRGFSQTVPQSDLVWHRDAEYRTITVVEGRGWKFQRDNQLPQILNEGDTVTVKAGEYHRLIKGNTDLVVTIVKEGKKKDQNKDGKNNFEDVKIARMKASGMSDKEIREKHPELFEKYINEKKKGHPRQYDAPEGSLRDKALDAVQAMLKRAKKLRKDGKAGEAKDLEQRAYKKRERMEKKERDKKKKNEVVQETRINDPDILSELIEEIIEEEKLYLALEEVYEREEERYDTLNEKKKRKKKKRKKKKSGSRKLSKSIKKALDKKADARCLTRGSVYREFRAGLGAYYSSGSRKGMTPHQWAYARVNSAQPSKDWAKVKKRKKCPKKKRGKK